MDNSIREELEAVLGKDAIEIIEDDPEQAKLNNNSDAHTLSNMKPSPSQEDGMIIDKEADTTHTEEAANGPQDTMYAKKHNPTYHQPASIPKEQEHDTRRIPPTSTQGPHTFSISPLTGQAHSCTRNVSFAATVRDNSNLRGGREGHLQGNSKAIPPNPYEKSHSSTDHGFLHPQSAPQTIVKPDKVITLKKNAARPHIHRYTLRFKTIKEKNEEEAHQLVKESLQRYLDIVLQADPKTIIPPFLELDRNDKSVSDLSAVFHLSSVDSYHVMKKYFFRLSSRDEAGNRWCSLILAQSLPFPSFMEKAKSSLENMNFSLWPKASDNENTMGVGWLLYSTRA